MTAEDAIRFLANEASYCRDHDAHEALCLLLPAMMKALDLRPMCGREVAAFRREFKATLENDFRFDAAPCWLGK